MSQLSLNWTNSLTTGLTPDNQTKEMSRMSQASEHILSAKRTNTTQCPNVPAVSNVPNSVGADLSCPSPMYRLYADPLPSRLKLLKLIIG